MDTVQGHRGTETAKPARLVVLGVKKKWMKKWGGVVERNDVDPVRLLFSLKY